MAADIHIVARLNGPGRGWRANSGDLAVDAAAAFIEILRKRPPFEHAGGMIRRNGVVGVWTIPGVAGVDFRSDGERLWARADSHALGPGYATALAFRLRAFADASRLVWRPADPESAEAAEIARLSREVRFRRRAYAFPAPVAPLADHERAARETAASLRRACRAALSRPRGAWPIRFGLPPEFVNAPQAADWSRPGAPAALLASGPIDQDEAVRIASLASDASAADALPWWRSGLGPETWLRLARAALWTAFDWAAPLSETGRAAGRFAAHALRQAAQARSPDIDAELDVDLFNAVMRADAAGAPLFPPSEGVGYRRRTRRWRVPGGWSVEAPGWCVRADEGGVARLSHWGFEITSGVGDALAPHDAPSDWRVAEDRKGEVWVRAAWRRDASSARDAARRAVASLAPWGAARAVC